MAEPWSDGDVLTAANLAAMPWGVTGYVNGSTSAQTGISTITDLTSLSVTWTAVSTRLYIVVLYVDFRQITSGGTVGVYIRDSGTTQMSSGKHTLATNDYCTATVVELVTGLSGSTTRKGSIETTAGTVSVNADGASSRRPRLIVFDAAAA